MHPILMCSVSSCTGLCVWFLLELGYIKNTLLAKTFDCSFIFRTVDFFPLQICLYWLFSLVQGILPYFPVFEIACVIEWIVHKTWKIPYNKKCYLGDPPLSFIFSPSTWFFRELLIFCWILENEFPYWSPKKISIFVNREKNANFVKIELSVAKKKNRE